MAYSFNQSLTPSGLDHIFGGEFTTNGFIQNNGILTCKVNGMYEINISGNSYSEAGFNLSFFINNIYQNGVSLDITSGDGAASSRSLKFNQFVRLNKEDKISFRTGTYFKNVIRNLIISIKYISE